MYIPSIENDVTIKFQIEKVARKIFYDLKSHGIY